ncbi:E3 ubiquitin-protein ligase HERC2 [Anopheles nili]|uniref:E3 ubiquitin-protein ligase HERC2 n=1 Tax=Anopheles nili TaxID=185578 RepID=UPI00237B3000|nr:E3 ubiquitin-protein ligase HERC2 [Anopheles nili]
MSTKLWIAGLNPFSPESNCALQDINLSSVLPLEERSPKFIISFGPLHAFIAQDNKLYTFCVLSEQRKSVGFEADILSLAANSKFCLVLLASGRLLKYDPSVDVSVPVVGFLGIEGNEPKTVKDESITHLACGECVTLACTSTNAIYNIPNHTATLPKHVKISKVVAGFEHCLLLTTNGDVYSWGGGLRGQLGNGEIVAIVDQPHLVEALAGVKIVDIAAEGWHSAAVSSFGDLYTWGWNNQGQLGLLDHEYDGRVVSQPQIVSFPGNADATVTRIHCGIGHTVAEVTTVDGTHEVLIAGWNLEKRFDYSRAPSTPAFDGFRKLPQPAAPADAIEVGAGPNLVYFLQRAACAEK